VTPKTITGTAFYLESTKTALPFHTVHGASDTTVRIAADPRPCPFNSAVISPDGRQIAWVSTVDPNGRGRLMVSDLTGVNRRTLPSDISCLSSTSLIWLNPTQISVSDYGHHDPNHRVLLDTTTGEPHRR
jgi:hypothetical protein